MVEFEDREIAIPCDAFDDRVLAALREAAGAFGGSAVALKRGGWRVSAGTWLSTNPNTAQWKLRARLEGGELRLIAEPSFFPWTRAKMARIAAVRLRQFADVLRGRLRSAPKRALEPREVAPFAIGEGPADACLAFAANAAQAAVAMALVFAAITLLSLTIIERQIGELADRAAVLDRIGYPALPSANEIAHFGTGDRIGAALLFAMPIAFFMGLVHALVHAFGDLWRPVSRMAPWASVFLLLLGLISFVPMAPLWLAAPYALLVPIAAQIGTTLVWGRRKERLRSSTAAKAKPAMRAAAVLLVVAMAYLLTPAPRSHDEMLMSLALFRDRWLLTSAPGRAFARAYYRWTPYAAEPLKEIYAPEDADTESFERAVRTALAFEERAAAPVRRLGFAVEVVAPGKPIELRGYDVCLATTEGEIAYLAERGVGARALKVLPGTPPADLSNALYGVSRRAFKAGGMRELAGMGLLAIHYLGALFFLALAMGLLCLPVALLYRKASRRVATGVVLGVLVAAIAALLAIYRDAPVGELASLRGADADRLAAALASPNADVRHEAAYRTCRALRDPKFPRAQLAKPLASAIADPDLRVRLWACGAAGLTGDPSVRPALLAAMEDPEIFVRYRAAEGLGDLDAVKRRGTRPPEATTMTALKQMARNASWYEGIYAIAALRQIDPGRW